VERMRATYQNLTIIQLKEMFKQYPAAADFKTVWGHNDKKKFNTLQAIINIVLPMLKGLDSIESDYAVMEKWASNADLAYRKDDPIGSLQNVGIATFQHMRMTFGANTVKPDQRVMEVLEKEFKVKLIETDGILAVEEIAKICKLSVLMTDQIFVRYGSGYYRTKADTMSIVEQIIRKLKLSKVDVDVICDATGWTQSAVLKVQ
jgi:hypothetical protein